jgi:nucleoside-diphosphate-sugar epimerase
MRIAVTGGTGKLGRAVVAGLRESGDQVFNLDAAAQRPDIRVDLTDYGQTLSALTAVDDRYSAIDAVVHLAAVPAPGVTTNAATFHNNITATYNVFAAAVAAGIDNVVWASSETLLGIPFETPPPYIPLDEEYPARPEWHYALAKHLEETMAAQFCRWNPSLKMIGLRFSNVMEPADYAEFPSFDADPHLRKWNLWGYIDARDGAQAVRKALDFDRPGVEIFIIACRSPASSASTRLCSRSTRRGEFSATNLSTAGAMPIPCDQRHGPRS